MFGDIKNFFTTQLNKFQSFLEIYKNFKIINSYKKILTYKVNKKNLNFKNIIIDGGFYNLGYLYRLQLIRAALNSEKINEHAFIWDTNKILCRKILRSFGIKNIHALDDFYTKDQIIEAEIISKNIKNKIDIINYSFKFGVPGSFLYDFILKSQKKPTVDLNDKNLKNYILKFISSIEFAIDFINNFKPDLIVLSHGISYQCAPLAWIGASKGIHTIVSYGEYGIPRYWRIKKPQEIFYGIGHPVKRISQNWIKRIYLN